MSEATFRINAVGNHGYDIIHKDFGAITLSTAGGPKCETLLASVVAEISKNAGDIMSRCYEIEQCLGDMG